MQLDATRTAFLFPGQGSQAVGMGQELATACPIAKETFEQADQWLGFSLSSLAWGGPEETLNDTVNTQPALLVHSVAALRVFQENHTGFQPAFAAGHSLGEFSALVAADALDYPDALRLVWRRGELMKSAGEAAPGGMAAILGLDVPLVDDICQQASQHGVVQVANDNCPGQVVVSGAIPALEQAMSLAEQNGARKVVRLAVSIAAHSPLMAHAQEDFNQAVAEAPIRAPQVPVFGNVSAQPLDTAEQLRADLQAQLTSPVRWTESIQNMLAQGVDTFIEIGTGTVLSDLLRRIDRDAVRIALGTPEDFEKLASGGS